MDKLTHLAVAFYLRRKYILERIEMFLRHKFKEAIMIYMQYAIAK